MPESPLPLRGRHAVFGSKAAFNVFAFAWLSHRFPQPGGVWWLEGEGDLVMEHLCLRLALEHGKVAARANLGDPQNLPGHEMWDFSRQPAEETQPWWDGLVRAKKGRDATSEERQTWQWFCQNNQSPPFLETDARRDSVVHSYASTNPRKSLGAILPEQLFPHNHLLWAATKQPGRL